MRLTALLSSLTIATLASAAANCPGRPVTSFEQLDIFKTFVRKFYVEKNIPAAFTDHVAESYIQHNPNFKSGRQIASDGLSKYIPTLNVTVAKISLSDNHGWVLAKQIAKGKEGYTAVVDIFRFDGSCVVEHWDIVQQRPANASNPLVMFDGQTFGNAV